MSPTLTSAPNEPILSGRPYNGRFQEAFRKSENRRSELHEQIAARIERIEAGGSRTILADWLENAGLLRGNQREELFADNPTTLVLHSRALTFVNAHIALGQSTMHEQVRVTL